MDQPPYRLSPFIDPASYAQDWRINSGSIITPASGYALLLDASPHRVSLLICSQQQQSLFWWPVQGNPSTDGLRINTGGQPDVFRLHLSRDGGAVQGQHWVAAANGVAIRVNYVETIWTPIGR